jgi:hypothetical protein
MIGAGISCVNQNLCEGTVLVTSGPIKTLGSQAFRESADRINTWVVRLKPTDRKHP